MKTVRVNQDLGAGWRLVSLTQVETNSKIIEIVLTKDGKEFDVNFDTNSAMILEPTVLLTTTQLHIIETVAIQLLK